MLPEGAIRVEQVWKRFRADVPRRLLRDHLQRLPTRLLRRGAKEWRWVLRDITLSARPGDSIGLVGRNGSGKSTLLKILARVMYPNAGRLQVAGRVGALIEVRAGIHPDLSGRENAYLYGTLLGLSRNEVAKRFDQIVSFAELENAIDRQVKFYSTGMQMRLGFAVASHLDPNVLLVDEVLAVGDASFQQRCLERMRTVLNEGTTIIYVSHDLDSVEAVCKDGIWLHDGAIAHAGPVREALGAYRQTIEQVTEFDLNSTSPIRPLKVRVSGPGDSTPATQRPFDINMIVESDTERIARIYVGISEGTSSPILAFHRDFHLQEGQSEILCSLPRLPLPRGRFFVWLGASRRGTERGQLLPWGPVAKFDVSGPDLDAPPRAVARLAPVHAEVSWDLSPL